MRQVGHAEAVHIRGRSESRQVVCGCVFSSFLSSGRICGLSSGRTCSSSECSCRRQAAATTAATAVGQDRHAAAASEAAAACEAAAASEAADASEAAVACSAAGSGSQEECHAATSRSAIRIASERSQAICSAAGQRLSRCRGEVVRA